MSHSKLKKTWGGVYRQNHSNTSCSLGRTKVRDLEARKLAILNDGGEKMEEKE